MKDFLRRLFGKMEKAESRDKDASYELYHLVQARQSHTSLRLQRLEIEANLPLRNGKAGTHG